MFTATIIREALTDGSYVYDVALTDGGEPVATFNAYDEKHAVKFAADIINSAQRNVLLEINPEVQYNY